MKLSKHTLVHTPNVPDASDKLVAKVAPVLRRISAFFEREPTPLIIGVWDLGAWLGGLPQLIEAMNGVQQSFIFSEVKATVPAGLISRPQRVIPWLNQALGRDLTPLEELEIKNNLIANDYFELAESIRRDLKMGFLEREIDYVVGITPSMVAGEFGEYPFWNYFATFANRTVLVSTFQLREFAEQSGRPFEAFLAGVIVVPLLVARFSPKLQFHENRGCLFDFNADRRSIMEKALDPKIEPDCMNAIEEPYRAAVQSLVDLFGSFRKE